MDPMVIAKPNSACDSLFSLWHPLSTASLVETKETVYVLEEWGGIKKANQTTKCQTSINHHGRDPYCLKGIKANDASLVSFYYRVFTFLLRPTSSASSFSPNPTNSNGHGTRAHTHTQKFTMHGI